MAGAGGCAAVRAAARRPSARDAARAGPSAAPAAWRRTSRRSDASILRIAKADRRGDVGRQGRRRVLVRAAGAGAQGPEAAGDGGADFGAACIPVTTKDLSPRGAALLECLQSSPDNFCEKAQEELQAMGDGLLDEDSDLPSSVLRAKQRELAHDIMYVWMLAEAYCADEAMQAGMRKMLHRADEEALAEGDSRRRQLTPVRLMTGRKGSYRLGSVRFSRSETNKVGRGATGALGSADMDNTAKPGNPAYDEWLKTQEKPMAIARDQVWRMFAMWSRSGYMDRRLEDRTRLDRMVTGKAAEKSSYLDHVMQDLLQQQANDVPPSQLTSELLQIRSKEAWSALQLHTDEILELDLSRPKDEFAESILTDFGSMGQMMEEASRCGRSLFDAEKLVLQYIDLPEWSPESMADDKGDF